MFTVKIIKNDITGAPGKVADVELHFTEGPLAGLRLCGFAIWERRITDMVPVAEHIRKNNLSLTVPSRQYAVNGERRSFALLRPQDGDVKGRAQLETVIFDAYRASLQTAEAV
jgi:hypothetical protein